MADKNALATCSEQSATFPPQKKATCFNNVVNKKTS